MVVDAGVEIRFLGQPLVASAGESVKLARRGTTLTMLALLILRRDRPVSRTYLAFTLFPDLSDEQSLSELRRYLFHLTKALPPRGTEPYLIADSETVRWNERSDAFVDIVAFERLAQNPETHEDAVALYSGDLLEDVYDDWVVAERERLRSLLFGMLEGLVERYRRARAYPKALAYANRLLVADPWREDVVRRVMTIRYASGDATGALATFDRFAKQLRDEMGVDPMAETAALRETILHDRPLIDTVIDKPRGDTAAPARSRAATGAFIGRANELAQLHALWDRAARGYGNIIFLGGEAGVGKTALVGEFARIVDTEGGRVLFGETASPESSSYQCVAEALRPTYSMLSGNKANQLTISVLARVFPEWQEPAKTLPNIGTLPAEREVTRLLSAFAAAVLELGSVRPLLLVLEDLHWASSSTLDAITAICRRLQRARVIIVASYRDDEVDPEHPLRKLMNDLRSEERMTAMHLSRFGRDDIERIIRAHPAFEDADAGVAERFATFSEGNALFLTQALAYTAERRQFATPTIGHREIDHIVAARLAHLSDAAQTVAEIAAVCGPGCNVDIVHDVAGLAMSDVTAAFDELLDRRLIREAGARERFDFVFTHSLIRSAVYAQIADGKRTRRHARIAHVLEKRADLAPNEARELAGHYDLAGNGEKASSWFVRAAINAQRLYAHDDAVTFATRAIELAAHDDLLIEALRIREEAHSLLGQRAGRGADLDRLQTLPLDNPTRNTVLHRVVLHLHTGDDHDAEGRSIATLMEHATATADTYWQGRAHVRQARFLLSTGDYAGAKAAAAEAMRLSEPADPTRDRLEAISTFLEATLTLGELTEADELLVQLQDLAATSGDPAALGQALLSAMSAATMKQDFGLAATAAMSALEQFRAIGDRVGESQALASLAMANVRLSRWDEARATNVSAASICEVIGDRRGVARALMNLGMLHSRCGDWETGRAHFAAARAQHVAFSDRRAQTAALLNESFIALGQGQPADAKTLAAEAWDIAKSMDHVSFVAAALANLGAAERDLGELDAAIEHMEQGLAMQLALNRMSDAAGDLADVAIAYARRGDLVKARDLAEQILAIDASSLESAIFPPYPLWVVACIFRWTDDDRAAGIHTTAWQLAQTHAEKISEPQLRASFERLPFVVEMAAVDGAKGWPASPAPAAERARNGNAVSSKHGPSSRRSRISRPDVARD